MPITLVGSSLIVVIRTPPENESPILGAGVDPSIPILGAELLDRFAQVSKHQQGADKAQSIEPEGSGQGGEKRQP
jgi:hypothetical protein